VPFPTTNPYISNNYEKEVANPTYCQLAFIKHILKYIGKNRLLRTRRKSILLDVKCYTHKKTLIFSNQGFKIRGGEGGCQNHLQAIDIKGFYFYQTA